MVCLDEEAGFHGLEEMCPRSDAIQSDDSDTQNEATLIKLAGDLTKLAGDLGAGGTTLARLRG